MKEEETEFQVTARSVNKAPRNALRMESLYQSSLSCRARQVRAVDLHEITSQKLERNVINNEKPKQKLSEDTYWYAILRICF